jgi:hypothetical protein
MAMLTNRFKSRRSGRTEILQGPIEGDFCAQGEARMRTLAIDAAMTPASPHCHRASHRFARRGAIGSQSNACLLAR